MTAQWYILHALSGFEGKVAQTIREKAAQLNLTAAFEEIIVPTEEVVEARRGKKVMVEKKFLPGYILIKMELSDATWHLCKSIPRVTGFLGTGGKPAPIPAAEAERIFKQMQDGPSKAVVAAHIEVGDQVKVTDGPFESFIGTVEEVDSERQRVKLSVSIFGRATPVELEFSQVERAAAA
jgi:transcriptional antiterminator NusG